MHNNFGPNRTKMHVAKIHKSGACINASVSFARLQQHPAVCVVCKNFKNYSQGGSTLQYTQILLSGTSMQQPGRGRRCHALHYASVTWLFVRKTSFCSRASQVLYGVAAALSYFTDTCQPILSPSPSV